MSIGGSWKAGLRSLVRELTKTASKDTHRKLAKAMAVEALALVREGFRAQAAPDGSPWTQTIRGGQILRDTGRLANSWFQRSSDSGFVVWTSVRYAEVHQSGMTIRAKNGPYLRFRVGGVWARKASVTIPARPMLPEGDIPATWAIRFDRIFARTLSRYSD